MINPAMPTGKAHHMHTKAITFSLSVSMCVSEPVSGPITSVLIHEARRILVQWDELPVEQQRGVIINYTIYLQKLDSSSAELNGEHLNMNINRNIMGACVCVID